MTLKPFAAVTLAALLTVTALSTPMADARLCHPPMRALDVDSEGDVPMPPNRVEVEYPPHWLRLTPHWARPSFAQGTEAEGAYSHGCVEASGSVGGIEAGTGFLGGLDNGFAWQADGDGDGIGDAWMAALDAAVRQVMDYDGDDLLLVDEFRWQRIPICPDTEACLPPLFAGDGWLDGAEVTYWNNPQNDALNLGAGVAVFDPDRLIDTDGDLASNVNDTDSDDDGLLDGEEIHAYGSYPEYPDSDCDAAATQCKPSRETRFFDAKPDGPGTGDLLDDADELAYWSLIGGLTTDYDGDGIASNLLDADSDGDTLVDGEEVTQWHTKPYLLDSDLDGLQDGAEVRAYHTDPALWDSDDDGMPDGWETSNNLNPLAHDAALDPDADALPNLGEYAYARPGGWSEATQGPWLGGTNPSDPDTEGDALFDGAEVLNHTTDPHFWDTDLDGMADFFEATHGFNPLDAGDASIDADADSFDQGNDGSIQKAWPNVDEYRYGRTAWDEVSLGPWRAGTDPLNLDTDGDGAGDGQEAFFGTDARVPADVLADDDQDGLNWAEEARLGLNPSDPDTDEDGLCDGSRGANCHFPGMGSVGNMPGEVDYGSIPWEMDSDSDGRSDSWEAQKWDPSASGSAQDVDGDLLNGVIDSDSDADGLTDGDEFTRTTDMSLPDTDADGLTDGDEVQHYLTNPKDADHDDDGLLDGEEVSVHHTRPKWWDSDGDGLGDGAEVNAHGTDPLLRDSDQDTLPDGWEVTRGTQPRVPDADQDPDADGLSNAREYSLWSLPLDADSDDDALPDAYEDQYGLGVTWWSASDDADLDGYSNINEHAAKTHPRVADTDGDGRLDGWEASASRSDPLDPDTDKDGLNDGAEYDAWIAKGYAWNVDHDGDSLRALRDPDSDNDGLNDRDELVDAQTKPHVKDSDGDGLSDYEEVVVYGGQYNPNDADTDNDGQSDGVEVALADTNGDFDRDGLKNGDEGAYGTDPTKEDTDCDGAQDGPEYQYWIGLGYGAGNLLIADVDGDSIKDGIEIGTVSTPSQTLYKTRPDAADTDGDGIMDGSEARNNVKVVCGNPQASMSFQGPSLPMASPLAPVPSLLTGLVHAGGFHVGQDEGGWYVQGGYGVKLYLGEAPPSTATPEEVVQALTRSMGGGGVPGSNGQCTDPTFRDTDADGLSDFSEQYGLDNPYKAQKYDSSRPGGNTNPCSPNSDQDGISDGLELGFNVPGTTWALKMNPNSIDSDGDRIEDNVEDSNRNGADDLTFTPASGNYQSRSGTLETSPVDADTDDDGVSDLEETGDNSLKWDRDNDGLSDGLELGKTNAVRDASNSPVNYLGELYTRNDVYVFQNAVSDWKTWQPWQGVFQGGVAVTTLVDDPDSDDDGIPDGLEDLNHNGLFGDYAFEIGTVELSPTLRDLNLDGRPDGQDTDGDGIMDGRELLVYSASAGKDLAVRFSDFMGTPGFSLAEMVFDAANPWETDPRDTNTDAALEELDVVPDGSDINPRADAFLGIQFEAFDMKSAPDTGDDKWWIDLYFDEISVTLPVSGTPFILGMTEGENVNFHSKNPARLPGPLMNALDQDGGNWNTWPATLNALWRVQAIAEDGAIKLNLPDGDPSLNLDNMEIKITVKAMDSDFDMWGAGNPNDRIDLNSLKGETALHYTIRLGDDVKGQLNQGGPTLNEAGGNYLAWPSVPQTYQGFNEGLDNEEDGRLSIRATDAVPKHFLQGLQQKDDLGMAGLPSGSCAGQAECIR